MRPCGLVTYMLAAAFARPQQAAPPLTIHSPEELDAYVAERLMELDTLIREAEKAIETLTSKKDEKVRAWYLGALSGLKLARSAWNWWTQRTP